MWFGLAVGVWLGVIWAYVAVMHAKAVMERGELSTFWRVHMMPLAGIGLVLDCVFQIVFGTLMFGEMPEELLFTGRVQRHIRESTDWRYTLAMWWAKQLNTFDANHIRLP